VLRPDAALETAATVPFAIAVVVITVGVVRSAGAGRAAPAELAAALGLGLEFLLAAGLLRLSAIDDPLGLAAVAAIVLLRRLITTGIRFAVRALGAARVSGSRA
jgi:uncharacterized membrane protein